MGTRAAGEFHNIFEFSQTFTIYVCVSVRQFVNLSYTMTSFLHVLQRDVILIKVNVSINNKVKSCLFLSNYIVAPMVTFPAAMLAIQGGMLSCSARGTPPTYTALIRNSTVLVNTTNTATIRLHKDGNYICQAINQYGTDVKELQVNFTSMRFFFWPNLFFFFFFSCQI